MPDGVPRGGAVVRNHVKRRVREAFRSLRVVPVGVDVVVVPKDAARYAPFPALVGSLQELLGRVAEETP
ncbi:MAG: ribonuclease P protein component [Armatimonadetes bacterium]|nr:ribonuclease P protein component [Armatimonadota bacterium]